MLNIKCRAQLVVGRVNQSTVHEYAQWVPAKDWEWTGITLLSVREINLKTCALIILIIWQLVEQQHIAKYLPVCHINLCGKSVIDRLCNSNKGVVEYSNLVICCYQYSSQCLQKLVFSIIRYHFWRVAGEQKDFCHIFWIPCCSLKVRRSFDILNVTE